MNSYPDNTPFFVLGAARSGTTMLRLMLNCHSRLAIPYESQFLYFIFAEMPIDRPLAPHEAARTAELVIGEKNFRSWHLDPTQVRQELIRLAPAPLNVLVDTLFRMEIADSGKPRWGDKTPNYYRCWQQLMRLFPSSKLVHIIRDGRDVCVSLEKVGWHGPTNYDRAHYWRTRVEMAHAAAKELGPERNLIIRYEDLVLETQATLETVCAFLGETYEPQMLNFFQDATAHLSDIDGDVHGKVQRAPRPEDVECWSHEMSPARQLTFEAIAGSALRSMSYPVVPSRVHVKKRDYPTREVTTYMTTQSPRIDKGQFEFSHQVYYGTDDGFKRLGSLEEEARHDAAHVAGLYKIFARYENFHQRVAPDRRANIHLASVVGGLYGLNLIPLFRPKEITFFDVNPHAVIYFTIIRRVWIDSRSAAEFLAKLASADYEADTPEEREIRACLAARQNGTLTEDRGQPARTLLSSWRYALDHFELTQQFLAEVPVHTRVEDMRSSDFAHFVATHQNLWIFCSNVIVFAFFDLRFQYPQNAAVFGSYFDRTEMLDLGGSGGEPVTVHCRFPMSVSIEDRTVNHRWHYNIL